MKKGMKYLGMAVLLVCLLILCMAPATCRGIDEHLQVLSVAEETVPIPAGDAERIESLTALIVMYSEQLEEYDRSNGSTLVGCIGFAGVVLGFVINLSTSKKEKGEKRQPDYVMAALCALIPVTMALYLHVFSMQYRRVAFFRGYLAYLEEELSKLTGIPMVFNSNVVGKFFGVFDTINAGFIFLGTAVATVLSLSCAFCMHFALPVDNSPKFKPWKNWSNVSKGNMWDKANELYKALFCHFPLALFVLILAVSSLCCMVYVYDLCINGNVPRNH